MAKKIVKITCKGAGTLGLPLFEAFQGEGSEELKTLSKEDYERLKTEIEADGFSFPVAVWANSPDGKNYILDGHQRVKTLTKMRDEGYTIPELPIVMVDAPDFKAAKRKLLAAASQYGAVQEDGLLAFLKTVDISPEDLVSSFRLPEIDINSFVEKHLLSTEPDPLDFQSVAVGETSAPPEQTADVSPKPPPTHLQSVPVQDTSSQVRMVQLFLNGETQPEFLKKIQKLQEIYETANVTDTVMEVIREAYNSISQK